VERVRRSALSDQPAAAKTKPDVVTNVLPKGRMSLEGHVCDLMAEELEG